MFRMIKDAPVWIDEEKGLAEDDLRQITIEYNMKTDGKYIDELEKILDSYPTCERCINFYIDGEYSSFRAICCKLHGCLDEIDNPHFDLDGLKCDDFKRNNL